MGEVYRARDSKLDRQVAIKILPALVAADPERRARFEREARALASLNHPNIAHIYGVEETGGEMAIVMELVEGEDLAARLARGPLTWPKAQPLARQLADALDAAHERGIVHRDLKPANIRITPDETLKVLDFGLAKAVVGNGTVQPDPAMSPTFTSPSTHLGTIIGTAAYMAPEQAKGKAVDKRADLWAFGCVLFEMLSGRSPFGSETAVESLGLVVTKEPEWTALPPTVPGGVVDLLRRCLAKDPKHRLRDIGDATHLIAHPENAPAALPQRPASNRRGVAIGAALGLVLAAVAAALAWTLKPAPPLPLRRLELPAAVAAAGPIWIAPDGTRLAYFSGGRLLVRALYEAAPHDIADAPPTSEWIFWSPDSRFVGYVAQGTVRTVPASGGPLFTVCRVPGVGHVMGIVWRPDNTIVFSSWRDNLYKVAAAGGEPETLIKIDPKAEVDFHEVHLGRGGQLLAAVHSREGDGIRTEIIDGTERRPFANEPAARDVRYVQPGFLMFRRVGSNQGLWVLPWTDTQPDLSKAVLLEAGATHFSAATDGTLVIRSEVAPLSVLAWVTQQGEATTTSSIPGAPIPEMRPRFGLSPAGDRVVFVSGTSTQANVIVRDLATGADTRVTGQTGAQSIGGTSETAMYPDWFPAGDRVLYTWGPVESSKVVAHRADGAGSRTEMAVGMFGRVSADGKWFLWLEDDRGLGRLHYAPLDAKGAPAELNRSFPGLEGQDVRAMDLSPDSRLLAYTVREANGQGNVHLSDFPAGTARWQVTTSGGAAPRFSADGRELFYFTGRRSAAGRSEGMVMVMPLTMDPAVKLGVARVFFQSEETPSGFDVARDGRLLIARRAVGDSPTTKAVLVQNWPALLDRR